MVSEPQSPGPTADTLHEKHQQTERPTIIGIQKASKLKAFGVFRDYSWPPSLPGFKKYNLIYGWNRSGKTTLSRAFSACEKRTTQFGQYPAGGQFELLAESGSRIKSDDLASCSIALRVFNKDFVDGNISFDPSNACSPIVQVSEADIESEKKLNLAVVDEERLSAAHDAARKERDAAEKSEDQFLRATALTVKQAVGKLAVRDQYYAYDKTRLEQSIATVGLNGFTRLSDQDAEARKALIESDAKPKLTQPLAHRLPTSFAGAPVESLQDMVDVLNSFIEKQVVSETIDRLKNDRDLNSWVARGLELHRHTQSEECLFCQRPLDAELLDRLSRHFSEDYENLQRSIQTCLADLEVLRLESLAVPVDLYPEFKGDYQSGVDALNALIVSFNEWVDEAKTRLDEKLTNPLMTVASVKMPSALSGRYDELLDALGAVVDKHNLKVDNHGAVVTESKDQLASHIVAVAMAEQDYAGMLSEVSSAGSGEAEAKKSLQAKKAEIAELRKRTSNIGRALGQINMHLEEFFGRKEIQLELDESGSGYVIHRDGEIACNLSEGEKTAIAFSYFLVKVEESGFRKQDGVIVIDDPISSLDSNFVFHCFSLIKNHFGKCGQLIVLTHNFELFNLVKTWLVSMKKRDERCGFYMVENATSDGLRRAELCALEDTLLNFKSEYHYLFVKLSEFAASGQPSYEDLYTISNIARRFLEVFASFKIPTRGDLASKLNVLVKDSPFDGVKKDRVYRLVNEYSHGLDPTTAIEHKDKVEAQEAVRILLRIVKHADSRHYELLAKNVGPVQRPQRA